MEPEAQCYMNSLGSLHQEIRIALQGLPPKALNWRPPLKDANTIAVIVTHAATGEAFMVYQGLTGKDVGRVRLEEFLATATHVNSLLALVDQVEARIQEALSDETSRSLNEDSHLPNRKVSKRHCVVHAIDHTAIHVGHLQLTRQLWDQRGALARGAARAKAT